MRGIDEQEIAGFEPGEPGELDVLHPRLDEAAVEVSGPGQRSELVGIGLDERHLDRLVGRHLLVDVQEQSRRVTRAHFDDATRLVVRSISA